MTTFMIDRLTMTITYTTITGKQKRVKMAKKYKKLKRLESFWPRLFTH